MSANQEPDPLLEPDAEPSAEVSPPSGPEQAARPAPVLFLSHSGADTAAALELKRRILEMPAARRARLEVWVDKTRDDPNRLVAGPKGWLSQLEEAIARASAFCVYVGRSGITNWVEREVWLGLSRATGEDAIPFIPVMGPDAHTAALSAFARQHQAIKDPLNNPTALEELVTAVLGKLESLPEPEEPYVGLRSMQESDAHLFFGRETEIQDLATKLRAHPLVAVVADSGAGKSSLVRAGLVPAFRAGILEAEGTLQPERVVRRHVVIMRPGGNPREGLVQAVEEAAKDLGLGLPDQIALRDQVDLANIGKTEFALRCGLPVETDVLLVVDQFEELLTQAKPTEAAEFVGLLLALVDPGAQRNMHIVLTVRADYFNLISRFDALFARLTAQDNAAQLRLSLVSPEGLARIVQQPLRMVRYRDKTDAEALLKAIRRDISDRPGDLALVQMALAATWRRSRQNSTSLTQAYAEVGGVMGALAHEAERVRKTLNSEEQTLLLPLFARLIALGDTGGATRRIVPLDDLSAPALALVRKLTDEEGGRLLQTSDSSVEIAHEALITQWPWLQSQISGAADDIRRLARLSEGARAWNAESASTSTLPNAAMHQSFNRLRANRPDWLSDREAAYLDAANRHVQALEEKERADRARLESAVQDLTAARAGLRRRVLALAFLFVLALLSGALAGWYGLKSNQEAWSARRNEAGALAALSRVALQEGRPVDAVKLALAAWPRDQAGSAPQVEDAIRSLAASLPSALERVRLEGHEAWIASVAFSLDGARVATASVDGSVRLWEAATGAPIGIVQMEKAGEIAVALSPDGTLLATGSDDGTVRLWDVATGSQLGPTLEGHQDAVTSVAFSPDGTRLATASDDRTARLWDVATAMQIGPALEGHARMVASIAFSPDGTRLATGSFDGTARLWDVTTGEQIGPALEGHENLVWSLAFSPDGTRLATGSYDTYNYAVRLWDVATGASVGTMLMGGEGETFSIEASNILTLALSPDGTRLAIGLRNGTARLWDVTTGRQIGLALEGHEDAVTRVAFSPDGTRLATGSYDNTARLWEVTTGALIGSALEELEAHESAVASVAFSPDGMRLATGSEDGPARLWDVATGEPVGPALEGHEEAVMRVAFSLDGTRLVTGSVDGTVRLWAVATGALVGTVPIGGEGESVIVALSPDGTRLATASENGPARLWDVATGEPVGPALKGHEAVMRVAFSLDGTRVATGSADGTARLWGVATGEPVGPALKGDREDFNNLDAVGSVDAVTSLAFSPDGMRLATGYMDGTTRLWDVATGKPVGPVLEGYEIAVYEAAVWNLVFSPDGTRLATGLLDGTVRLWDVATGALVGTVLVGRPVLSVAFSPDGRRLATGSENGMAQLWDLSVISSANGFEIACAGLPLQNGAPDKDLAKVLVDTSIRITEPICGPDYDPPMPWWIIPGGTEPQPPGVLP